MRPRMRSAKLAASAGDAARVAVSTVSRPCTISDPRNAGRRRRQEALLRYLDALGELEQFGRERRLAGIILPGGRAGEFAPLVDGGLVEIGDFCALLGIDLGDLRVVGHRL